MIYHIKGRLSDVLDDSAIVDVTGLGYQVILPQSYLTKLPEIGSQVQFYTHHHIREDQQVLFGFLSREEKQFFVKLTSVSGVGPKIAVKMLSELSITDISQAILKGSVATLTQLSGVGKKMAERLIIELKDKLDVLPSMPGAGKQDFLELDTAFIDDLSMALKALGYSKDEIKKGMSQSKNDLNPNLSLEQCIKVVLKKI